MKQISILTHIDLLCKRTHSHILNAGNLKFFCNATPEPTSSGHGPAGDGSARSGTVPAGGISKDGIGSFTVLSDFRRGKYLFFEQSPFSKRSAGKTLHTRCKRQEKLSEPLRLPAVDAALRDPPVCIRIADNSRENPLVRKPAENVRIRLRVHFQNPRLQLAVESDVEADLA